MLIRTGQGVGRQQLIRLDPAWLLVTSKQADFTTTVAAETWNQQEAIASPDYVSTCMYYRRLPAKPGGLKCGEGNDGTALRAFLPPPHQALCLAQPPGIALAAALWNFPSASRGIITAVITTIPAAAHAAEAGSSAVLNASWALTDAAFPPWDEAEQKNSVFHGAIDVPASSAGPIWADLTLVYDIIRGECTVSVNGRAAVTLPLGRRDNEGRLSYLALRVHGSTALCVRSLTANRTNHTANADSASLRQKMDDVTLARTKQSVNSKPTCSSNTSDCTAELQAALDVCSSNVILERLPDGRSWITRPLFVRKCEQRQRLELKPGVVLEAIKGGFHGKGDTLDCSRSPMQRGSRCMVRFILKMMNFVLKMTDFAFKKMNFVGPGAFLRMHRATIEPDRADSVVVVDCNDSSKYSHSEGRMAIALRGVSDVAISIYTAIYSLIFSDVFPRGSVSRWRGRHAADCN